MTSGRLVPLPYRARAIVGGEPVAESDRVIRQDPADGPPQLWFPVGDVQPGAAALGRAGEDDLAGHVVFGTGDVQLELVDGCRGDDPRDVTVKRFPTWGDASDLIAILDVRPDGDGRYASTTRGWWARPVVEGSQLLAQAIVAASRHAPAKRVVSASMTFTRPVDPLLPYWIELEEVSHGRTFTAVRSAAVQGGRTGAFGSVLLDVTAPEVIRHDEPPPDVAGPYGSTPFDMSVTGRDLRIVDDAYTGDPDAPVGPPELAAWVRFRDVPPDPPIHAGLLAQLTGHLSIAAALRPHAGVGQDQAHRTLSTAINAISLSIHREVRADRWMLYHHRSTVAAAGMTHAECRVHGEDGAHLASFTVDAMVRGFGDPEPRDERTAL
jgi:acyl-CoA thioesterase